LNKAIQWIRKHPLQSFLLLLLSAFGLLNFVAYQQASAMLNFTQAGIPTARPEDLSLWQKVKVLLLGVTIPKPKNQASPQDFNLAFETHRLQVDDTVELEAWYIPRRRAKGLVLMFHGYAVARDQLLPEARAFHQLGYAVFLVDFRGSGGSNQATTSAGFYEAEDVTQALAYVQTNLRADQPVILYGQSMGGAAILRAVQANDLQPDAIIIEAVFDRMLSTVENRFNTMGVPSFPAAHLLVFWGSVQRGYNGFEHNPLDYAPAVKCPILMLHGQEDPRVTLAQAKAIYDQIRSEKVFEPFEKVGHESYIRADEARWKAAVGSFLAHYKV
jgi:alpha-beta hydrolase superfamily lysophospholipase